ncbi:MAG: ABC transporter substrate-binding protein [Spirochaetia bacterium]|nr:ABC transporter substrate-binding protein [Spirochaetia bacterium]
MKQMSELFPIVILRIKRLSILTVIFGILLSMSVFAGGTADSSLSPVSPSASGDNRIYSGIDSLGNQVTLDKRPASIVIAGKATLIPADAVVLFESYNTSIKALGITDQGLGDFYRLYLSDVKDRLPHTVSAEEIAGTSPDLVIIKDRNYNSIGKQLEKLGIPVFTMYLESPEDYIEEIIELGNLFSEKETARNITDLYEKWLETVSSRTEPLSPEVKEDVLLLYANSSDGITSFQIPPASWIQTFITREAGGNPVWADSAASNNWQLVSFEQISAWDPDRIYIISYKTPAAAYLEEIEQSALWKNLSAYRNGFISTFPADFHNWAQPDTRWILGLQWLAKELHPELFADLQIETQISSFYKDLYNIDDPAVIEELLSRFSSSLKTIE